MYRICAYFESGAKIKAYNDAHLLELIRSTRETSKLAQIFFYDDDLGWVEQQIRSEQK